MVEFSRNMGCYIWTCIYGHSDFDFESKAEATLAFARHECVL